MLLQSTRPPTGPKMPSPCEYVQQASCRQSDPTRARTQPLTSLKPDCHEYAAQQGKQCIGQLLHELQQGGIALLALPRNLTEIKTVSTTGLLPNVSRATPLAAVAALSLACDALD